MIFSALSYLSMMILFVGILFLSLQLSASFRSLGRNWRHHPATLQSFNHLSPQKIVSCNRWISDICISSSWSLKMSDNPDQTNRTASFNEQWLSKGSIVPFNINDLRGKRYNEKFHILYCCARVVIGSVLFYVVMTVSTIMWNLRMAVQVKESFLYLLKSFNANQTAQNCHVL